MTLSSASIAMAVAACVMALYVVKWDPPSARLLSSVLKVRVFNTTESVGNRTSVAAAIPTASDFAAVREAYFAAKADSKDPYDEEVDAAFRENPSDVRVVPLEIRASPFGGRGLFTQQHVAKGQTVFEERPCGIFRSEVEWRRFLDLLPSDDLRFDVVLWSYVLLWTNGDENKENADDDEGTFVVGLDLDEGSLLNHGALKAEKSSTSLLTSHGFHTLRPGFANVQLNNDDYLVATRDIEAGEEILCDYGAFHQSKHSLSWYEQTWDEFIGTK